MAAPTLGGAFAISTPEAMLALEPTRTREVPFTVTNLTGHTVRARLVPRGLDGAPDDWFSVMGEAERSFGDGGIQQVRVLVDPALGAAAGTYAFRLDVVGIERPGEEFAEGPSCAVDVPGGPGGQKGPRGYVATLVGATVGGVLWLIGVLAIVIVATTADSDCEDVGGCIGEIFGLIILLVLLGLVALVLMWIGSAIGIWLALRKKRYRGAKLTALFFAVFMIPWTFLVGVILNALDAGNLVVVILAPVLLLIVPSVLARGLVLLIRTRHI